MIISTFRQYGNGQRIGFAAVCIGFAFCFVGCVSPYWLSAKTSATGIVKDVLGDNVISNIANVFDNTLGDVAKLELHAGIWVYCVKISVIGESEEKCSDFYNTNNHDSSSYSPDVYDNDNNWITLVRAMVSFNIIFSFIAMCVACCRCLCCSGGRTICHGVLSFLAGGAGMCAFIIFYNKTKALLDIPIVEPDYDWALVLFTLGSILMIIASLLLCFAVPRESYTGGVILANSAPGISVNVSNVNQTHMNNQYAQSGQINSFEPLPQAPPSYSYAPHYNPV